MMRFKIHKLAFITVACSMSLLFTAPSLAIQASAATPPSSGTVSPQADVITWVYQRRGNEVWKCLYNTSLGVWVGDWVYVGEVGSGEMP